MKRGGKMWVGIKKAKDVIQNGRWNVEFYTQELVESRLNSVYPFVSLGDIVSESRAATDPQNEPEKLFNYIGLENVKSLTGELVKFTPLLGNDIKSRSKVFKQGNILYGRLRPSLNKVFAALGEPSEGICSNEFVVLIPNNNRVLPKFLRYMLASEYVTQYVTQFQSGAALPRVAGSDLLKVRIPLPPLSVQSEIEESLTAYEDHRQVLLQKLIEVEQASYEGFLRKIRDGE